MELDVVRTSVYVVAAAGLTLLLGGGVLLATAAAFVGLAVAVAPRGSAARSGLVVAFWAGAFAQLTATFSWPFDWLLRFLFGATLVGAVVFYSRWRLADC